MFPSTSKMEIKLLLQEYSTCVKRHMERRSIQNNGNYQEGAITPCKRGQNMRGVYTVSDRGFVSQNVSHNPHPHNVFCCNEEYLTKIWVFLKYMFHFISVLNTEPSWKGLSFLNCHRIHA